MPVSNCTSVLLSCCALNVPTHLRSLPFMRCGEIIIYYHEGFSGEIIIHYHEGFNVNVSLMLCLGLFQF